MVRLSSQNQTIFRCHQWLNLSYEASRITSATGRNRKPGFKDGTVQKEQEKGQPLVACITFFIKNLLGNRSYRGVGKLVISQGVPLYTCFIWFNSISRNISNQTFSASPVTIASK